MELIKSYKSSFTFNDKEIEAIIKWFYDYEMELPDVCFDSKEEEENYFAKFESGEYTNLWLMVEAHGLGEIGLNTLGQVHILSSEADKEIEAVITGEHMVKEAINDLISVITNKIKLFENTLGLKFV